mmetsp:Transcript_34721/g.55629  ORF Transcript_34721/g.55629 Transcript_34721/m.55629 type:complete len:455 (+) Transcript_34721:114-1478(+)
MTRNGLSFAISRYAPFVIALLILVRLIWFQYSLRTGVVVIHLRGPPAELENRIKWTDEGQDPLQSEGPEEEKGVDDDTINMKEDDETDDDDDDSEKEDVNSKLGKETKQLKVVLYSGFGSSERSVKNIGKIIRTCARDTLLLRKSKGKDFFSIADDSDVIMLPGGVDQFILAGIAKKNHKTRDQAIKALKQLIGAKGKGYVGICAGAYIAANWLYVSPKHVAGMKGSGYYNNLVYGDHELGAVSGVPAFENQRTQTKVLYMNGPIFASRFPRSEQRKGVHDARSFIRASEHSNSFYHIHKSKHGTRPSRDNSLRNRTLITFNRFKKGRVIASSIHPETKVAGTLQNWVALDGPPECDSPEAKLLLHMIFVAGGKLKVGNKNQNVTAAEPEPNTIDEYGQNPEIVEQEPEPSIEEQYPEPTTPEQESKPLDQVIAERNELVAELEKIKDLFGALK